MKVAIAGAGKVGRSIARELIANNHEVLLLDKNAAKAKQGAVSGAAVLVADACEISALDEAGLPSCQVVVAATGDDKVNLVVSLLAKTEYGVPRVVARVTVSYTHLDVYKRQHLDRRRKPTAPLDFVACRVHRRRGQARYRLRGDE